MQKSNSFSGLSSLDIRTTPLRTIKLYRYIRLTGTTASFLLFLFATLMAFPFAPKSSNLADAIGTPIESETTIAMNIDKASANLSVAPVKPTGTFTSSSEEDLASFDVITNNYTGYTLSITATDDDGKLTSSIIDEETGDITATSTLDSISNATDRATFAGEDNTVFNGRWGYKPSKYNSTDNIVFLPSPTTDADILDTTNKANNEANNYTIGLGARVDYTKLAGTYSNTFILTAVGNPVAYVVNYSDNSGDTDVTNMPDTDSSTSASTKVAVSSRIPSRGSKYTFAGWCDETPTINADGSSTCNGTIYQPSTESTPSYVDFINQTAELSTITLYTTWNINSYLQTVEVRYQNADGSWTNYETYDTCTKTVAYGETHSCSIDATTEYQAASLASYTVTGAATKQIDVYRNTYTVSISNSNTTSGSSSLTIRYGGSSTVTVTPNSGYYLSGVSCPSGYTCSGYSTGASYTGQQTVTVNNNNTASGGTLTLTGTVSGYNCNKQYRLQNADGSYPSSYTSDGTVRMSVGSTCSYSKSVDGYQSQNTSASISNSDVTLSLSLPRNTYIVSATASWSKTVSGTGTYRWGQYVSLTVDNEGTKCVGTLLDGQCVSFIQGQGGWQTFYYNVSWSQTSGDSVTLTDANTKNVKFTMPKSSVSLNANLSQ